MKGIIFNLLEEVIFRRHGEAVWDELLDRAGLNGTYTSLGSYPDAEIFMLVDAASQMLSLSRDDVLRWFGREAMPLLAERYPVFFTPHVTTAPFLKSVNAIIHPEVRKLYAGAGCPHFQFTDIPDGGLRIGYTSSRHLCALAHGFIEGAAQQFHEHASIEHVTCMNHGDAQCDLLVRTSAMEGTIGNAA
jgi:Haem-NO-binding